MKTAYRVCDRSDSPTVLSVDITISIPSELAGWLQREAEVRELSVESLAGQLLARSLPKEAHAMAGAGDGGWFTTHVYDDPH